MKYDKETDEEGKKRGVRMERNKAGMKKKKSRRPLTSKSKYTNNKHNVVIFYKKYKKYNDIHLTKNKMDLNNRIM